MINRNPSPFPNWNGNSTIVNTTIFPPHMTAVKTETKPSTNLPKIVKSGTNGSLVVVIMDESGSMASTRSEVIGGVNLFAKEQLESDAEGNIIITAFDGANVRTLRDAPLSDCAEITEADYNPRGMTNLYDAIGEVIEMTNTKLASLKKKERPAVVVMIMTDGQENSSRKYRADDIKKLVGYCEKKEWSFMFLGANIDSFAVGSTIGMNASNSMNYSMDNLSQTISVASTVTSRLRSGKLAGLDNNALYATSYFSDAERNTAFTKGGNGNA